MSRVAIHTKNLALGFARIQFYNLLVCTVHPAEASAITKNRIPESFGHVKWHTSLVFVIFVNLQARVQQAASRRGFFLGENCIPGNFEHGNFHPCQAATGCLSTTPSLEKNIAFFLTPEAPTNPQTPNLYQK